MEKRKEKREEKGVIKINKSNAGTIRRNYNLSRDSTHNTYSQIYKTTLAAVPVDTTKLPHQIDLRETKNIHQVYNRENLGSSTACSWVMALETKGCSGNKGASRLFQYYNERSINGNVGQDSGTTLTAGAEALIKFGVCSEKLWKYDTTKFADRPSIAAYEDAVKNKAAAVKRIPQNIDQLKQILFLGHPFVFGMEIYSSFESKPTKKKGIVSLPLASETVLGGQAMCAVGYDDIQRHFIVANSLGESWGDHGYFYLPYDYIADPNLAYEFWFILDK